MRWFCSAASSGDRLSALRTCCETGRRSRAAIGQHSLSVCLMLLLLRRVNGSTLIRLDYPAASEQRRREKGSGERRSGGRAEGRSWDAEACVLTVRCCSSGLVHSSYRLKGDGGVGRAAETWSGQRWKQRVHTWTMRHNDHINMRRKIKDVERHNAASEPAAATTHTAAPRVCWTRFPFLRILLSVS